MVPQPVSKAAVDLAPLRQAIFEGSVQSLEKVRAAGVESRPRGARRRRPGGHGGFRRGPAARRMGQLEGLGGGASRRGRGTGATASRGADRDVRVGSGDRGCRYRAACLKRGLRPNALSSASPSAYESRFAGGRIKFLRGELGAARVDLERALASWPGFTLAALDQAAMLIDAGEASTSASQLDKLLADRPDDLRAQPVAGRGSAGSRRGSGSKRPPCDRPAASRPAASTPQRALCAFGAAAEARLAGDRPGATRHARAAVATGVFGLHSARATAQAALILASTG